MAETTGTGRFFDRRTVGKIGVGFLIALIILYLFGVVIGWNEILDALADANLWWIGAACLSTALCLVVWAKSLDVILQLLDIDIPFRSLVPTYYAAMFADYVTPFGKVGGGPFIAYIISRDRRASYEEGLAGFVTADLLNLVPFFAFASVGFVALVFTQQLPSSIELLVAALAGVALIVPILIYLSYRKRATVERILVRLLRPIASRTDRVEIPSVRRRVEQFYERVDVLRGHPRTLLYTLVFAFGGWVFFAFPLWLVGRSVGVFIDPVLVLFIVPASALAGFTPTPGGLGGVEVAITALLVALVGLPLSVAAAIALLYRVASYWFVLLVGGIASLYEVYNQ